MKNLTILVLPVDGVGHVNACAGTALPLLKRGHRVIFLLDEAFRGRLAAQGFEEFVVPFDKPSDNVNFNQNAGEMWAKTLVEKGVLGQVPLDEKFRRTMETFLQSDAVMERQVRVNKFTEEAIRKFKPDLFIIDIYLPPCIYYSGIPWINNISLVPLMVCFDESDQLPPACSGISLNAPRDEVWHHFKEVNRLGKYSKKYNDYIEREMGYKRFPDDIMIPHQDALLTLYACPEEYNYPGLDKLGWFNIEVFNKNSLKSVVPLESLIPREFFTDDLNGTWSGKWIYLSMGSMGSVDLELMKRLVNALSQTPHKCIVSKGPRHAEFELPKNAWGDRFLPQTSLVPQMDLVITHGGNNTVTETFAQGKPMIVLPLFSDQIDNGQRLQETGLAVNLDPYKFTDQQLISAVNRLLGDEELKVKLKNASDRILTNDRHGLLAAKIEQLWLNNSNLNVKLN